METCKLNRKSKVSKKLFTNFDLFQHSVEENSYEPYSRLKYCSIFSNYIAAVYEKYAAVILEEDELLKEDLLDDVRDAVASDQIQNLIEEFDLDEFDVYRAHSHVFSDDYAFNLKYSEMFFKYVLTIYETMNL